MKKSDKINYLHNCVGTYHLCRCYFKYDINYWYFYILGYSEKFILGIEEDDFILDGFQIRKISDLKKIEIKDDICVKINKEKKLLDNVQTPDIDLSAWKSVFQSLKELDYYIIIQNEKSESACDNKENLEEDLYYIGTIKKVNKSTVELHPFDADGIWFDEVTIPYSKITSVTFGDRYSKTWKEYLSKL